MVEENQGLSGRSPAEAGSGCQPSASAASASSQSGIPNADGWIAHMRGEPCPLAPDAIIEVQVADGREVIGPREAATFNWLSEVSNNRHIVAYRGVRSRADRVLDIVLHGINSGRSEPLFIARDCILSYFRDHGLTALGIVAATAGETEGLDERSEQSPVGEAETPKAAS